MSESGPRWEKVGLTEGEYGIICRQLGRQPNELELGLYGLMWSEHCSYKSSRKHLASLPTKGSQVLQGPGENAGAVRLAADEDTAVVFRIESHNHPSAVEPVQGAATGVGGILRDVFAMGARPIALFNSLRFGNPDCPRARYLFDGVVRGIASYGNCVGVPTVGGEIYFDEAYKDNPLVNVMCIGITTVESIVRGRASGVGNSVFVVGAATGRDGIHGASLLASREFDDGGEDMRPAVQVGDPFCEKLLIEACLQLLTDDAVVGINDLGAAGLTSAASETAARAGTGIEIDVARVPRREEGMTPYEVMLSESQERMLVIVEGDREQAIRDVFSRWELEAVRIGEVIEDTVLRVRDGEQVLAELPVDTLVDAAPAYCRPAEYRDRGSEEMPLVDEPEDLGAVLVSMLGHPNLCDRRSVYQQFDHMVGTNTVVSPGADAAVLRVKGSRRAVAATVDGNGMLCHLDPARGAENIVAEAYRNLSAVGARPLGLSNCLNFASPEKPEVMGSFIQVVEGMARACRKLDVPVTGGNVSFYNETGQRQVYPTPTVGMVGGLDDVRLSVEPGFSSRGDLVVLVGRSLGHLGGSQYLNIIHQEVSGPVAEVDFSLERAISEVVRAAAAEGLLSSSHDVSDGGIATALAECCCLSPGRLGASVVLAGTGRSDALLFGEEGGRIVVSLPPQRLPSLCRRARKFDCPVTVLGMVGGKSLVIHRQMGEGDDISPPAGSDSSQWRKHLQRAQMTAEKLMDLPLDKLMQVREDGLI